MEDNIIEMIKHTREYREKLLQDKYRPAYHFAIPDGDGRPGDVNGTFFADGRYHLMYLYKNYQTNGYHWGHISSGDLLHWRCHQDALTTEEGDEGCYSGGAFVDDDGVAYLTFWKFPSENLLKDNGGIGIAYSKPPYEKWKRMQPIAINGSKDIWGTLTLNIDGKIKHVACADPSNIWKSNGFYYLQSGNLRIIENFSELSSEYKGDYTDLFKSKDLRTWEYVGKFYDNPRLNEFYPDESEDDMCPSFLPLPNKKRGGEITNKYLQLFISHNRGSQYYIGEVKGEKFFPETHGRFTWNDYALFAPEALIDADNRHIAWFWIRERSKGDGMKYGWSGVFSFPRVFWIENDVLHMAPADELEKLQFNRQNFKLDKVDGIKPIGVKNGESCRLKTKIKFKNATFAGIRVKSNLTQSEYTDIYVDKINNKLIFDSTKSGKDIFCIKEEAPFELKEGEYLEIDLFIDKSVIEVYVNERQAICRKVYSINPEENDNVFAISNGAIFEETIVWEMFPTNMY